MGPPVPRIYRFARFLYNNVFYDYRDLLCPGYAFECRSVRMCCFGILQLCDLEFICFLYKVYDHLCARLWFLRFFYASFYFLFSVLLSLILFIRSLFLVLYIWFFFGWSWLIYLFIILFQFLVKRMFFCFSLWSLLVLSFYRCVQVWNVVGIFRLNFRGSSAHGFFGEKHCSCFQSRWYCSL